MDLHTFARDLCAISPEVREELRRTEEEPDDEMPTVWMGYAGRAIAQVADRLSEDQQWAVFDLVERGMTSGSELMRTIVSTGLIEGLANAVSRGDVEPTLLASLLGPESRAYLDAWDQFTLGRSSLEPS